MRALFWKGPEDSQNQSIIHLRIITLDPKWCQSKQKRNRREWEHQHWQQHDAPPINKQPPRKEKQPQCGASWSSQEKHLFAASLLGSTWVLDWHETCRNRTGPYLDPIRLTIIWTQFDSCPRSDVRYKKQSWPVKTSLRVHTEVNATVQMPDRPVEDANTATMK